MNLLLDVKTTFLLLGIGHLFTLILISAYWRDHRDITVKTFILAKGAQTLTWFFQAFHGQLSDFLSISVSNSLLFIGTALEVMAILSLQDSLTAARKKLYMLSALLSVVGFHMIVIFYNQVNLRIAFASMVTSLMVIPIYRLFTGRLSTKLMKIMGYLYLFVIVASWFRGGSALFFNHSMDLFTASAFQTVTFLSIYLVMILGNTGFILLLKERADRELVRLASRDDLTDTLNRRTYTMQASQCLAEYAKRGEPVSYLLFDIDHFKAINDTYGHSVGDKVLLDLTEQIKRYLDKNDLFVRYGGDEFGILLPGRNEQQANIFTDQVRQAIQGADSRNLPITYTISMGILTIRPDSGTQLEMLYTSCDKALYMAKNHGRNTTVRGIV